MSTGLSCCLNLTCWWEYGHERQGAGWTVVQQGLAAGCWKYIIWPWSVSIKVCVRVRWVYHMCQVMCIRRIPHEGDLNVRGKSILLVYQVKKFLWYCHQRVFVQDKFALEGHGTRPKPHGTARPGANPSSTKNTCSVLHGLDCNQPVFTWHT